MKLFFYLMEHRVEGMTYHNSGTYREGDDEVVIDDNWYLTMTQTLEKSVASNADAGSVILKSFNKIN